MNADANIAALMQGSTILTIALIVFLFVALVRGIRIVPQSQVWVTTKLGRFNRVLGAGVNVLIPFIENVHTKATISDQVISDIPLDVVSADNVVFGIELMVVYRIVEAEKAVFRVNDVGDLIRGLVRSLVRSEMGKVELDKVQSDRDSLNIAIRETLANATDDYGVRISRAEITDVKLSTATQRAMAEVLEAERQRRAAITRAEGEKRAVELAADAELYQKQKEAEAQRVTADATAYANGVIAKVIADSGEAAARFQIAERQITAVEALARSPNAKLVMIPGDITDGWTRAAALLTDTPQAPVASKVIRPGGGANGSATP